MTKLTNKRDLQIKMNVAKILSKVFDYSSAYSLPFTATEIMRATIGEIKKDNVIISKDLYEAIKEKCSLFDKEHPNTWGKS